MRKNPSFVVVAAISLLVSPSCSKKSSNSTSTPACKIITITDQLGTSTTTYNLTYDNEGRISTEQFVSNGVTTNQVFTYIGNTELMSTSSGTTDSQDSITLNSDGLLVSDYHSDNSGATSTILNTFSGTELQKQVTTQGAGTPMTTTFTWSNGDMVSSSGSPVTTYTYNAKASEAGDYWQVIQLLNFGVPYLKTAHQLAGYQYGTTIENINYTYDSAGKITNVAGTQGSDTEAITYQYMCN